VSSLAIASIVFACVFGSAMLGLALRAVLPVHHLETESKDVVKLGTGLVATMAALVLSLLISSAKSSFDRLNSEVVESASKAVQLDRVLADYGPETKDVRDLMKRTFATMVELLASGDESQLAKMDTPEAVARSEGIQARLRDLSPRNDSQRGLQSRALQIAGDITSTRWLFLMQRDVSLPMPLLVVLVVWLTIIFAAFGLLAPRNATVIAALFLCALSASGAILLILEMNSPLTGVMRISTAPFRDAVAHMGQ
jgi:hypothetical protein